MIKLIQFIFAILLLVKIFTHLAPSEHKFCSEPPAQKRMTSQRMKPSKRKSHVNVRKKNKKNH